jgi:hypothetical protein
LKAFFGLVSLNHYYFKSSTTHSRVSRLPRFGPISWQTACILENDFGWSTRSIFHARIRTREVEVSRASREQHVPNQGIFSIQLLRILRQEESITNPTRSSARHSISNFSNSGWAIRSRTQAGECSALDMLRNASVAAP